MPNGKNHEKFIFFVTPPSIIVNLQKETKIYHIHSDFTMCEWVHMLQLKIYASIGAIGLVGPQDITQAKLN